MSSSTSLLDDASNANVVALLWHCDENVCFINFVTKSMHSIEEPDRQSSCRIPMNSHCCVAVTPEDVLEQCARKNSQCKEKCLSKEIISCHINLGMSMLHYFGLTGIKQSFISYYDRLYENFQEFASHVGFCCCRWLMPLNPIALCKLSQFLVWAGWRGAIL